MILPPPPSSITPAGVLPSGGSTAARSDGRDANGRWLPGASANPRGRPVVMAELKKLAREQTPLGFWRLVKILEDDDQPGSVHVQAVQLLWSYGYGKPVQQVELGGPGAFEDMEEADLLTYVRVRAKTLLIDDDRTDK
jgi:hypothetical protein